MMKVTAIIAALVGFSLLGGCAAPENKYKESGTGSFFGRALGYKEEQVSPNRWLISFNVQNSTKEAEALRLLYKRVDEVGHKVCKGKYTTDQANVKNVMIGANVVSLEATAVMTCQQ